MSGHNGTLEFLRESKKDFLQFLKGKYSLYHLSNVFFRDLHYGVSSYLSWKRSAPRYTEAEELTRRLVAEWVAEGLLREVGNQAFVLNYPEFKKPPVKPAAPAKPAAKPAATPAAAAKPSAAPPAPAEKAAPAKPEAPKQEPASPA